jgi:negative regulator of replication initiation
MSINEISVARDVVIRCRKLAPEEKKLILPVINKLNINVIGPNDELTGKKVRGFRLEEKKYNADSYIDVLRKIIKIVFSEHPKEINKILSICGRKRVYFSHNSNELRMPELIRGTNIHFETNENAKSICMRCEKILKLYNMDYLSFEIEYYR